MQRAQWLLAPLLDATRPMDAMALSLDLPAEDEIATGGLSGIAALCCHHHKMLRQPDLAWQRRVRGSYMIVLSMMPIELKLRLTLQAGFRRTCA